MKAKEKYNIKTEFSFEAPVINASKKFGLNHKKLLSSLDLNSYLAPKPETTYMVRVVGDSMIDENIYEGDILVVDKSIQAQDRNIVIASLNGEMAVKKLRIIDGITYLFSANKKFLPIEIKPFWNFQIQGVVKFVIKDF